MTGPESSSPRSLLIRSRVRPISAVDWANEFGYTSKLLANHSLDFFRGWNNDWQKFVEPDDKDM